MILATNLIHIRKNLPIAPSTRLATPISHACSRAKHHEAQMSLYTVYSLQHMQLLGEDSMMCADTLDERPQNPVICNPTKPATTCRFAFWCKMRPKFGARLVQNRDSLVQAWCKKGQGICPDLESSGRVDWIRTSDPLTPSQVRYQTAPPPALQALACANKNFTTTGRSCKGECQTILEAHALHDCSVQLSSEMLKVLHAIQLAQALNHLLLLSKLRGVPVQLHDDPIPHRAL